MSISTDDLGRITQETAVVSSDGERLGEVHQVYTSDTSGDPAWVTVRTGRHGSQESFVPLSDASLDADAIRVAVSQEAVHGAPRVDAGGHLSVEEEDDLYRYYAIANPDHSEDDVAAAATGTVQPAERDQTDATTVGPAPATGTAATEDGTDDVPGTGQRAEDYVAAADAQPDPPAQAATSDDADRDDELAARDAEGRDEVVDEVPPGGSGDDAGGQQAVRPGERTTRLRRYVVTERVIQTVEELPDDQR